jgi:hypothetical protein
MSESLVFEVGAPPPPTPIALEDLRPEDVRRFLTSQRMILENTLELHARRDRMEREQFLARSSEIARDQREFKESFSQFIEIHGAEEVVHEHREPSVDAADHDHAGDAGAEGAEAGDAMARAEAAHESAASARVELHDHGATEEATPVAGPYRDLVVAIRAMWDAERALGIGETGEAIPAERRALEFLKKAQRAVRYFPRVAVKTKPIDLARRFSGDLDELEDRVERLAARDMSPEERATRDALATLLASARASARVSPDAPSPEAARRVRELGDQVSGVGGRLLGIESGYEPALVAVAARCSAGAAEARRLAAALDARDAGRSRSSYTAMTESLVAAASQLAALLDARPAARGAAAGAAASAGERRRASEYFRRLSRSRS